MHTTCVCRQSALKEYVCQQGHPQDAACAWNADAGVTQRTPNAGESEHEGKNLPPCISLVLLPRLLLLLRVHHFRIFLTHARLRAKGEAAPAVLIDHLPAQSSSTPTKTTFSLFQCKPCFSGWEGVHKITFPA
jgi:hypothetical protein